MRLLHTESAEGLWRLLLEQEQMSIGKAFQEARMGRKFDDLTLEEKIAHFDDVAARALLLMLA